MHDQKASFAGRDRRPDVGAAFAKAGGAPVTFSFAGSSALARQIEQGAPADLYVSADPDWMNDVEKHGLVQPATRKDILSNHLALVAPKDSPVRLKIAPGFPLLQALGGGKLAMAEATVPAALYGKAALETLHVWTQVEGQVARAENVRGADVAYRLQVSFEDAAALKPQRVTLASGKTIEIKLPNGVETGTQRRLAGQGEPGPGGAGDATVTIEITPHRFYMRDGDDIRIDLPVRLDEAVLGGKVKVPTVDGTVMLTVPAGSTSGKVLRLKGKGFHRLDGTRGDQLVTLSIDLPPDDPALQAFAESWQSGKERNPRASLGV